MEPRSKTRILGISSGKGGVGKSSVTVNLAVALARAGYDVGILDADVYGFSVPKMLGITTDPLIIGDLVVPPTANGVRCLSMGFFVADDTPVIWRGPMLHKALEQFLVDAYWGEPDFLLIDMPPGTGDVTLSLGQYLTKTEVFVVTTPQPAAQRVAQRSAYAARKLKLAVRGVIENMSWFTGDDGTRYELFGSGRRPAAGRRPRRAAARPDPAGAGPARGGRRRRAGGGGRPRRRGRRGVRPAGRHHRRRSGPPASTAGSSPSGSRRSPGGGPADTPAPRSLGLPPGHRVRPGGDSSAVASDPARPGQSHVACGCGACRSSRRRRGRTPSTWWTAIPPSSNPMAEAAM